MADYSKWDQLAREEEAAEKAEKEAKRNANRESYYKSQEEKKAKWDKEQAAKGAAAAGAAASAHGHSHGGAAGGDHGHSHGGDTPAASSSADPAAEAGMQPLLSTVRRPACGCGYADVNELKRASAEAALQPQLSESEKNARKLAAVHATREHGKQLYTAGQYAEAFAVYERGVLIASGVFNVSPETQAELTALEVTLDLNMAMCQLKLGNFKGCMDQARMALQLDAKNVKAHYRMAQAHVKLGEYTEARACITKASGCDEQGSCKKELGQLLHEIKSLEAAERIKVQQFAKQMELKMAQQQQRDKAASAAAATTSKEEEEKEQAAVEAPQASNP